MRVSTLLKAVFMTMMVCAIIGEETEADKGSPIVFSAEVGKMLDILINSLYTNRNIFLREIISNASDALDKIRFLYLTDPKTPKNDSGEEPTMDIRIKIDREGRKFIMRDGGIGMTKADMEGSLGSLGSSGTKKFLESMKDGSDNNFIGQFGVGFYSVFLVAERVKVASKHDDSDKQWVWESTGDGTYFVYEDKRGNTLGRGTELTLELKKDADEYLEADKIKEIIHRHSEFIHFPIMMEQTKIERVKKEKAEDDAEKKDDDDATVSEEGEKKDEDEYEDKTVTEWATINENKPIWTRKAEDITDEEYNKFYKALTKDYDDPMYYTHFSAEGEVEFKALLFVPGRAPYNVFDTSISHNNIRLYVRRVFITDEFKDLLPRYLNFIKGVVDSNDLPLHVSREVLQESRILKIIKKKLVRKALTMLQEIADNDKRIETKDKDAETTEEEEEAKAGSKKQTEVLFPKFWEEFGKNLRLGMIEDGTNRARLTKLLRYKSSKSEDKLTSLEEYVERMPDSQKAIYFLSAESIDKIQQSPMLEDATKRDIEVLYMTDAIDEYVVGHVTDFGGKKLVNLAKGGTKLEDKTARQKKIDEKRKEKFEPLTKWIKSVLGDKVTKVSLCQRKTSEAFLLANSQYGVSSRMHQITKAQTLGEKQSDAANGELEINHLHPLVDEINKRIKVDEKDTVAEEMTLVLYDLSALQNGFEVQNTLEFGRRVGRLMRQSVDIARDAPLLEEDTTEFEVEIDEEEAKEAEDKKETGDAAEDEKKEEL